MEGGRGRARGRATAKPVAKTITPGPSRGLQPAPVNIKSLTGVEFPLQKCVYLS